MTGAVHAGTLEEVSAHLPRRRRISAGVGVCASDSP